MRAAHAQSSIFPRYFLSDISVLFSATSEHDDISHEVPTFRADPVTPACDKWCPFPVADRPNSVRQFLQAAGEDLVAHAHMFVS